MRLLAKLTIGASAPDRDACNKLETPLSRTSACAFPKRPFFPLTASRGCFATGRFLPDYHYRYGIFSVRFIAETIQLHLGRPVARDAMECQFPQGSRPHGTPFALVRLENGGIVMHVHRFAPPREMACPPVPRLADSRAARFPVGASTHYVTLWDEFARPAPIPTPAPAPAAGMSRGQAVAAAPRRPYGLCSVPRRALF
jgi:hypothetical protein